MLRYISPIFNFPELLEFQVVIHDFLVLVGKIEKEQMEQTPLSPRPTLFSSFWIVFNYYRGGNN